MALQISDSTNIILIVIVIAVLICELADLISNKHMASTNIAAKRMAGTQSEQETGHIYSIPQSNGQEKLLKYH